MKEPPIWDFQSLCLKGFSEPSEERRELENSLEAEVLAGARTNQGEDIRELSVIDLNYFPPNLTDSSWTARVERNWEAEDIKQVDVSA